MAQLKSTIVTGNFEVKGENSAAKLNNLEVVDQTTIPTINLTKKLDGETNAPEGNKAIGQCDLLDLIYPIGSIFTYRGEVEFDENENPICPIKNTLGGTWKCIKDTFLYATDGTSAYPVSDNPIGKGGAKTVAISAAQMPSHNHTPTLTIDEFSDTLNLTNDNKNVIQTLYYTKGKEGVGSYSFQSESGSITMNVIRVSKDGGGGYNTASRSAVNSISFKHGHTNKITISETGGGQAHNNMPPYLNAYIWQRIA